MGFSLPTNYFSYFLLYQTLTAKTIRDKFNKLRLSRLSYFILIMNYSVQKSQVTQPPLLFTIAQLTLTVSMAVYSY